MVLCCSPVSNVGLIVIAFEAVGCCISMGDVRIRFICCFVGVVWYQTVPYSELLDGMVKLPFCTYSCVLDGWVSLL
jgi:hypothetical protein